MATNLKKNLLFAGFVLAGIGFCGYLLLPTNRVPQPKSFQAEWNEQQSVVAVLDELDREFEARWDAKKVQATLRADDLTIVRRLSLGLTGSVPSLEELRRLEQQPESERVNWWISRLLEDRRTSDYLAERLARAYVGTEDGPFLVFRRRRFVNWLSEQIHSRRPYNEIVNEMLVDQGIWTDSAAVNFVTVTMSDEDQKPDPIRLAGRTSRAFLGMRIDCLQCHDDFLGTIYVGDPGKKKGGRQTDFHRLAAFFNDAELSLTGIRDTRKMQHYQYQFLDDDEESVVEEGVPFAEHLLPENGTRRQRLAKWITHPDNKQFARAMVNRIWAIMAGRPLVEPIDDIPLHGKLPPGIEILADDFIDHDYDLHRLIRLIAASSPFQRDSKAEFEITAAHEYHWAAFPLTRLRPEQVAGGIVQSTSLVTIDSRAHVIQQLMSFGMQNDFVSRYGDIGEDEFDERGSTVTQRLILLNGNLVQERLNNSAAPQILPQLNQDDAKLVETAYLTVLTRRPNSEEQNYFTEKIQSENRNQAVQDLYWVLLNSFEFAWNH